MVMQCYYAGHPEHFNGKDEEEITKQVEEFAFQYQSKSGKLRFPVANLQYEVMTDQIDVWFIRDGIRRRFMTLMAS